MSKKVEFFFDIGSPTAYLAHTQLTKLSEQYRAEIVYEPMLLGGVFKATNNAAPGLVPAKGKYMLLQDLPRFVKKYNVPFKMNPHFPVNTLLAMRGCFAARELGVLEKYVTVLFDAMWVEGLDVSDEEVFKRVVNKAGIDADNLHAMTSATHIKELLKENTTKAVAKGCFGAPTMFVGNHMFFGQDRLDFLKDALAEQ